MPYSQTMIILFFDEVILAMSPFFSDELSTLIVNPDNINLDDVNFDEDNPDTIIYVRLIAWRNRRKQRRASKKRYKQRIKACSMASKMVGLVLPRR